MFEFTCPKCQKKFTLTAAPTGKVAPCAGCDQPLRVVPEVVEEGLSLVGAGAPAPPARGWAGPLLAAGCTAAGVLAAAAILVAWIFLGRGPAAGSRVALADATAAPVNPSPPAPPAIVSATKPEEARPGPAAAPSDLPKTTDPPAPVDRGPESSRPQEPAPPRPAPAPAPPAPPVRPPRPPEKEQPKEPPPRYEPPPPPLPPPIDPVARAQALTSVQKADPDLLAEGPEPVVVGYSRGNRDLEDNGSLCFLRKTELLYRDDATGKCVRFDARSGRPRYVETADKKYRWEWDADRGEFTGKARPVEAIDLSPRPALDEAAFLFAAVEELYKELEYAEPEGEGLAAIARAAAQYRARASSPKVARLCDGILTLVGRQKERDARIAKALAVRDRDAGAVLARLRRDQLEVQLNGFRDLQADSFDEAFLSMLFAGARVQVQNTSLAGTASLQLAQLSAKAAEDIDAALRDYENAAEARWRDLCEVGEQDFGRPPYEEVKNRRNLLATLRQNNDRDGVSKFYAETTDQERNNPFRISERCLAAGQVPMRDRQQRAAALVQAARECAAAARLVPDVPVYDRARLLVLKRACLLACAAGDVEVEGQGWASSYSPAAAYAVRLIDRFNDFGRFFETSGELRELRAWALAESGRPAEALDQALKVQDLRQDHGRYAYNLARLYGSRNGPGDVKEAMKWLEHAVKVAHFAGIAEMRKCPDLEAVRIHERRAFRDLTAFVPVYNLEMGGRPLFGPAQVGEGLAITNRSAYPWTNVSAKVQVLVVTGGRAQAQTLTLPDTWRRIEPQQTVTVKNAFSGLGQAQFRVQQVVVECDQSRR